MTMTAAEFDQWKDLPHFIVIKYFSWAFPQRDRKLKNVSRYIDYDDLVSEANLALLASWEYWKADHKTKAKFITYASKVCIQRVAAFIDANRTPVSTKGWRYAAKTGNREAIEAAARAMACTLFSETEIQNHDGEGIRNNRSDVPDRQDLSHIENFDNRDFHDHCIQRLKKELTRDEFSMLMERYRGKFNSQIGKKRGYTGERARQNINRVMLKATRILVPEIRDNEPI